MTKKPKPKGRGGPDRGQGRHELPPHLQRQAITVRLLKSQIAILNDIRGKTSQALFLGAMLEAEAARKKAAEEAAKEK